tara:strand:+ start:22 stop:285 length:264 start_codon:yes stop_codon:yes gene_type:complete
LRGVIFCALATIGVSREQITIWTINERWTHVWYEEKANGKEKIMSEVKKDVTVHVTGVSMSGGVKNDGNGSPSANKKEPEGKTARDS